MKKDMDAQFLCKDCAKFNFCKYYDRRKEGSYICKYFHLTENYGMTNGEYITKMVEQDEDFCIFKDHNAETVTIDVSLDWWNKPQERSKAE